MIASSDYADFIDQAGYCYNGWEASDIEVACMNDGQGEQDTGETDGPLEIAIVGDLTEQVTDLTDKLLSVPRGGECVLYFDSPGGSPYTAISLLSMIAMRDLDATGVVTGECSSAALWPFAACRHRVVSKYSVLLFHPMKSQSEEAVGLAEAAEWARHFAELEDDMDNLLAAYFGIEREKLDQWMRPGRYVTGKELADAGLAELIDLHALRLSANQK